MLLTLCANLSMAQLPLPMWTGDVAWPGLTQEDINRMHVAAARLYEGSSIGTIERWLNPETRDAGEIKLVRSFDLHGMPCRDLDYTIRFQTVRQRPTHYVATWCKVEGDVWKIVEVPRTH